MFRTLSIGCVATLFLAAIGCGGSTSAPSSSSMVSAVLHAEITDRIGDAIADARVAISPDLVRATADVSSGNLTLLIQFAPGTLDRQTTRVSVTLDTDQDASTGNREGSIIGADYGIDLAAATGQATITKADPVGCAARLSCFNPVGTTPIVFGADSMQVVVPLSLLGNDDGRMSLYMSSYVIVAPLTPVVFDYLPELASPPARIQ